MKETSDLFKRANIEVKNGYLDYTNESNNTDCICQIKNIVDFHNRMMGYRENIVPRFNSSIGKDIESFKVSLKKLKRGINNLSSDRNSTLNRYIFSIEKDIVEIADEAIQTSSGEGYYNIITRSMKRYEMCIGRADRGNLQSNNEMLLIGTTKYMSYNLIEHDMYSYLKKLRKKRVNINTLELIECFVDESQLDEKSIKYIKGLIMYPFEEIKIIQRYINGKMLDEDEEKIIYLINEEHKANEKILKDLGGY